MGFLKKSRVMSISRMPGFPERDTRCAQLLGQEKYVEVCNFVLTEISKPIRNHDLWWNYELTQEILRIVRGAELDELMRLIPYANRLTLERVLYYRRMGRGF